MGDGLMKTHLAVALSTCLAMATVLFGDRDTFAEEPCQKFLDELRDKGYYDIASEYLADMQTNPLAPPAFRQRIPLEQVDTLIRSTSVVRDPKVVEQRLDEAQKLLAITISAQAMMLRALKVQHQPFEEFVHRCKPHPGQLWTARSR